MTTTDTGKFIRLTENATKQEYIGWRRMVDSKLRMEGYFEKPGSWVLDKQINAYDLIVTNLIGQRLLGLIPNTECPITLLEWLKAKFGDDVSADVKKELKAVLMIGIQPESFFFKH